jgi:hypothetical protein
MSEAKMVNFAKVRVPEGCSLKRKELFEYTTADNVYDVELFESADGTYYAIGVPRDGERLVVYGSNVVPSAEMALQIVVDKIRREGVHVLFGQPDQSDDDESSGPDTE